jgi:hypothetical protein
MQGIVNMPPNRPVMVNVGTGGYAAPAAAAQTSS